MSNVRVRERALLIALAAAFACGSAAERGAPHAEARAVDAGAVDARDLDAATDAASETPTGTWQRPYDSACPAGTMVSWTLFSWKAVTPSDSRIELFARAGDTDAAAKVAARIHIATAAHQSGNTAFVDVGDRLGNDRVKRWLRIEGALFASSDGRAPLLSTAAMSFDCLPLP